MTENLNAKPTRKKTPTDATPFEREQLRFFLSGGDLAATLAEFNPSLAWLPLLSEMKLIQSETQLIAWIERNFSDVDAVRDVIANIQFFGPETANFLEFRLNSHRAALSPLLAKSWDLIIRHMRASKRGILQNEWFEIAPQIKSGDHSTALLERLADALRPKLKIGKRFSWTDPSEDYEPEHSSDLMSIDYEVEDSISSDDVIAAWPSNAAPEADDTLLLQLTVALNGALADATDVGVEREGFSTSDTDVPSVARHPQNEYRSGFQSIVRVMAEIWTRLAASRRSGVEFFVGVIVPRATMSTAGRWPKSCSAGERRGSCVCTDSLELPNNPCSACSVPVRGSAPSSAAARCPTPNTTSSIGPARPWRVPKPS